MALLFFSLLRNMFSSFCWFNLGSCSLFLFQVCSRLVQPSSRDLFVLISYIDSVGVAQLIWAWLKSIGRGSTYMAYPLQNTRWLVIYRDLIKQTSMEFRQKYSSRMWAWLNYLLCHALLKKILCTGGRFSCILTYSFIHKEFVECLCVNSCDLSKKWSDWLTAWLL